MLNTKTKKNRCYILERDKNVLKTIHLIQRLKNITIDAWSKQNISYTTIE